MTISGDTSMRQSGPAEGKPVKTRSCAVFPSFSWGDRWTGPPPLHHLRLSLALARALALLQERGEADSCGGALEDASVWALRRQGTKAAVGCTTGGLVHGEPR